VGRNEEILQLIFITQNYTIVLILFYANQIGLRGNTYCITEPFPLLLMKGPQCGIGKGN
jgi:hypothetical protein